MILLSDALISPATLLFMLCLWALVRNFYVFKRIPVQQSQKSKKGKNRQKGIGAKMLLVHRAGGRECLVAAAALLALNFADPYSPARNVDRTYIILGMIDERSTYAHSTSFIAWLAQKSGKHRIESDDNIHERMAILTGLPVKGEGGARYPASWHAEYGEVFESMFDVVALDAVGMQSWVAGTDKIMIDLVGLTDPYLSKTRFAGDQHNQLIAHFYAQLPRERALKIVDDFEAPWGEPGTFEGDLDLAVRSDKLFTMERWAAIARLNSGTYGLVEVRDPDPIEAAHKTTFSVYSGNNAYQGMVLRYPARTPMMWHNDARVWIPGLRGYYENFHYHMPKE